MASVKREFKKWFEQQGPSIWGDNSDYPRPIFTTYRQKNFTALECKRLGRRLDDYWWSATYAAFEAFKAGYSLVSKSTKVAEFNPVVDGVHLVLKPQYATVCHRVCKDRL